MIRKCLLVAVVAAMHLAVPARSLAQQPDIAGTYRAEGSNPDGTKYRGVVEIAKNGDTYRLRWSISSEAPSFGIGIVNGDMLAVSYFNNTMTGVILYKIEKGARLVGQWTVLGAEGKVYPETLMKAGLEARAEDGGRELALLLEP